MRAGRMNLLKPFECIACKGYGGETEAVLDWMQGPWYDCGCCKGEGCVGLFMLIRMLYWCYQGDQWNVKPYIKFFQG